MELLREIYESQYSYGQKVQTAFGLKFLTYADFVASGQPLKIIEKTIENHILPVYANTHTEASFTGLQTTHFREEARQIIKDSVNATQDDAVIFCGSGSTSAIHKLYLSLLSSFDQSDKATPTTVFIGPYEHHSNVLPWRESPFELIEIPMAADGGIDLKVLEEELDKRKNSHRIIGSFSAASNVTGIISPVDKINEMIKERGGLAFWDYAGGAPYMKIDMNPGGNFNKDAVFISPHKFIGGPGTPGILVVKKKLFEGLKPVIPGGGTVQFVSKWSHGYINDIEAREEGGTPSILGAIRAGLVFKLKEEVGSDRIEQLEHNYISRAIEYFRDKEKVRILGSLELKRLSFLSFHIAHNGNLLHHNYIVALLNDLFGIQSRGGCSCAGPYGHDLLQIDEVTSNCYVGIIDEGEEGFKPGWVRLNFNYFIPEEEFIFLLNAIEWISEHGWKLLKEYHFEIESGLWQHNSGRSEVKELGDLDMSGISKNIDCQKPTSIYTEYIELANGIVDKAVSDWDNVQGQQFTFSQHELELKWFSISDDVKVHA